MNRTPILQAILISILLLTGCSHHDDTCRKKKEVLLHTGIYTIASTTGKTPTREKLVVEKLTIQGIGITTPLYKDTKTDKFSLPLNKLSQKSAFNITFDEQTTDTLTFYYQNKPHFLSLACGSIYIHQIDSVQHTKHYIDSIYIQQKTINTNHEEQLQIYHFQ